MKFREATTLIFLPFLISCSTGGDRLAGNSTSTGNFQAAGRIVNHDGCPVRGVRIECTPGAADPWTARQPGWTTETDTSGRYVCADLPGGWIGIAAYDSASGLTRWRSDSLSPAGAPLDTVDTLAPSGTLRIALPPGTTGVLSLAGLTRTVSVDGSQEVEIRDIPAGWNGDVRLFQDAANSALIASGVDVKAGSIDSIGYTRRTAKLRVYLAGGLASGIGQVPLLLRLDSTWTGFGQSLPDGSDLRLATSDGAALPLTLADWNRGASQANLWTLVDSIPAPGDSLDLELSWGLPVPANAPSSAFAADRGWSAAWPLGDSGTTATERLGVFPGTLYKAARTPGVIGYASHFDGHLSHVAVPGTSTGALAMPQGGPYTLSCWVRLGSANSPRSIAGHGDFSSQLKFQKIFGGDTNVWLAADFHGTPTGGYYYGLGHADSAVWTHLAMTVSDTTTLLFVNGVRTSSRSGFDHVAEGRKDVDFAIGAAIDTLGAFGNVFQGDNEEVWVQSVARSPDWIRTVAGNQAIGARRPRWLGP